MQKYEKRRCMVCGEEFEPRLAQIVCCSDKCRKERRNDLGRVSGAAYRKRVKDIIFELEAKTIHLASVNEELTRKLSELEARFKAGKNLSEANFQLHECLRCNVKALNLPCGKNQICWEPDPCEKCKDMERPNFDYKANWKKPIYNHEEDSYFERFKTVAE